ncbi:MAG: hypothetical protein SFW67_06740 [Myxococcaceae bacterium]|nr:hypothetical protein [Myxococcaceae bacterium]
MADEAVYQAFRERQWSRLRVLCSASRDGHDQLFAAWAAIESGEPFPRAEVTAALADSAEWALHDLWGLWPFRKRVGIDVLQQAELHAALIDRCWRAAEATAFRAQASFLKDWVSQELVAFHGGLGDVVSTRRWQLGGARSVHDAQTTTQVIAWVIAQLEDSAETPSEVRRALEVLDRPRELRRFVQGAHAASATVAAISQRAPLGLVLGRLGRALSTEPPELKTSRFFELDALLLKLALEQRLDAPHRPVEEVLFVATPRRALDVAIARLEDGSYGTFATHLDGGQQRSAWTEGSLDDALAAVPALHFANAVAALHRPR